jgi:uncharacterized membrane protein
LARPRNDRIKIDVDQQSFLQGMPMKTCIVVASIGLALSSVATSTRPAAAQDPERLAQSVSKEMCAQVISCGTKDGKAREYPTPCAARDDGATNIHPKTGSACDVGK